MVRILQQDAHRELLAFDEALEALYDGCLDWAEHPTRIVNGGRTRIFNPQTNVRLTVHSGSSPRQNGIGTLLHTEIPDSDEVQQEYGGKGEQVCTLYDGQSAQLQGIIIGDLQIDGFPPEGLRGCQTAMDAAVDIDLLARENATDIGIFGSGKQAKHHLMVIDHLRDLETVRVYSPTAAHRQQFKDRMAEFVDADIQVVDGPAGVIEEADIVLCATNASSPVFDGDLLEPGQLVISIVAGGIGLVDVGGSPQRRRELDNRTVERADLYVTRSVELAREDEQGDFYQPVQDGILEWDDVVEIREIVAGDHPGRDSDDQLILYKQNSRQGITQTALMTKLFEKAQAQDAGIEL